MNLQEPSLTITFTAGELGELAALLLFISKQLDLMPESEERSLLERYASHLTEKLKLAYDEDIARLQKKKESTQDPSLLSPLRHQTQEQRSANEIRFIWPQKEKNS